MLNINMDDVWNILQSLLPQLIAIGVALLLAIIITIAVNKRTVANEGTRKLVHSQSWIVAVIAMIVAVQMMLFGPLNSVLTLASGQGTLSQQSIDNAESLAVDIQREGITLLQNDDNNLPLQTKKLNVFGWSSTNPIYGGSGSGSMNDYYPTVSLLEGMKQAGIETNSELSDLYTKYRADRPYVNYDRQDWSLPEVPAAQYSQTIIDDAKSFSNQAAIVISRPGGEGADLPTNMKGEGIDYTDNSTEYADFEDGGHFLQLSRTEQDMVDLVTKNFDNVTLIYNGANTFEFGFLANYPQIKSVLWCPPAGQTGFTALGEVLAGKTNPSGHTTDTFVKDLKTTPTWNNFGDFRYDNMSEYNTDFYGTTMRPSFVNYVEGIYVGYRFYETASDEGFINYDDVVQFPFGYGLSYTNFDQSLDNVTYENGHITADVTVTNTGDVAGRDAVELYYNPPYTNGGIEKASANLIAFDKTDELQPGESTNVTLEFNDEDMASYDYQNDKAYVLEAGDYGISLRSDSHHVIAERNINVPSTIVYDESNPRSTDKTTVTNQFDNAEGDVTYLSRANHFANYDEVAAAPTSFTLSDDLKAKFINNSNYNTDELNNDSDQMPTTGAKNDIRLADLYGADYDDARWDQLLDNLTFDDMDDLIAWGGYGSRAVKSIGKVQQYDLDGPAALNNNFTGSGSIGFPASVAVACTWNEDLATRYGESIGDMAHEIDASGWYAPAMNIHRNAFAGRNFEYFSEDGLLSGVMVRNEVAAARAKGVYAFIKHFALNDQETNRQSMLCTWATEQAIREIYLKPFEMAVKDGGAQAVMSAYNYIGTIYAGASSNLLNTVLRDEWGFRGMVLTDYFGGIGYQNANQEIRNGGDIMLATTETTNHITDHSATSLLAMRNAAHNILYTTVNCWKYENGEPKTQTPVWQWIDYGVIAAMAIALIAAETLAIRRFMMRLQAARKVEVAGTAAANEPGDSLESIEN
ncbi:beta-glucosidase [Bifidobacterium saguini DSM 23967]|uniref:Beta-glucosidase n=2 Tax=Bifidobacterium saguini TaxID=762210 RepID=A0A087DF48_9BIFI|nr:glycoside hydrolase family 3 protein [Bifidobacterium saguini]KFI94148.1 beta-glucosidase [Bifidobacterium saguini DSM 23967]QTB90446.1 glycoside hydrolase family 3 C-terminal domain-containing protein [Bifidobacterium saguini]